MKKARKSHIVLAILAALAAAVLFATYGTVLLSAPFSEIQIAGPIVVDSDGNMTAIADSESRRALILNADNNLTGIVDCTTIDAPFDAITDVCVSNGIIYLLGVKYAPDSDTIVKERVATYDKGGNLKDIVYEKAGTSNVIPSIKSLNDVKGGVVAAYEEQLDLESFSNAKGTSSQTRRIRFAYIDGTGPHELNSQDASETATHDIAFSMGDVNHYVTLSVRGKLNDDGSNEYESQAYSGHVFTAVDIDSAGTLYVCDDETGHLCVSPSGTTQIHTLIDGEGYGNVHENNGVISLCASANNEIKLCTTSGEVTHTLTVVKPSLGFSARMTIVWASGIYLAALALIFATRKIHSLISSGNFSSISPILLSVAVVATVVIVIGNLSLSSYQTSLGHRTDQINAYADYLKSVAPDLSEAMERVDNRDALQGDKAELGDTLLNLVNATKTTLLLVEAANKNNIGVYFTLYGRDDRGSFYLFGSSNEHVMGSSIRASGSDGIEEAFLVNDPLKDKLLQGRTLRDIALYRFVQNPSTDGQSIAGVVEIGSKVRSFESAVVGNLIRQVLSLLVMVLVVYLAYCEIRACASCLLKYRQRQAKEKERSAAVLTRPFTLAITMLTSIDSVMTVLIARDLLKHAGMSDSGLLLVLPAIMLGVGTIIGQGIYGVRGSRVGLRRLMVSGAVAMLLCACLTYVAVLSSNFWLYCAAKLAMAAPFGMLYALGYSLPRLAANEETRAFAADGVNRTNTSAAALGTVLGGYAAQALGNAWVYAIVAAACVPVISMALRLLPKGMQPLEALAQPSQGTGRLKDLAKSPSILAITFFVVLPAAVATGYSSLLFPLFSSDLGLSKADINNIVVLGQLVVFVCINIIDRVNARYGRWHVTGISVLLIGVVFLLFGINTTLAWSVAVVVLIAVLYKSSEDWKALWPKAASAAGVPAGLATAALLAVRSMALTAQPFILGALLGATDAIAVLIIGGICVACAALFYLTTRHAQLE